MESVESKVSSLDGPADNYAFKRLLESQLLVDCTLACDGGQLEAHKMILAACSSYLQKIIESHPLDHPVIILPNLKIQDLKVLVHYMYTGELLDNEQQPSSDLLDTASVLGINSIRDYLCQRTQTMTKEDTILRNVLAGDTTLDINTSPPTTKSRADSANFLNTADITANEHTHRGNQLIDRLRNNLFTHLKKSSSYRSGACHDIRMRARNLSRQRAQAAIQSHHQLLPGTDMSIRPAPRGRPAAGPPAVGGPKVELYCVRCQKNFYTICSYEYHMVRKHEVCAFECDICHKSFASLRYVLSDHMRRCHNWHPNTSDDINNNNNHNNNNHHHNHNTSNQGNE